MKDGKLFRFGLVLLIITLVGGCATMKGWFAKKKTEQPPEVMAAKGIEQLKKKKYDDAIETFEKLKDRYPYSEHSLLAQIKLADAYFYNKKYEEAAQAYKEFEKLHPTNPAVPYAIYRQGLCYYRQRSTIDRDQTFTTKAIEEFRRLKQKFPDSEYTAKADKYLAKCRRDLADHEFYVAEFYFKTRRYPAALERYQLLVEEYPEFPRQTEVKRQIARCQEMLAIPPEKKSGLLYGLTHIFEADW